MCVCMCVSACVCVCLHVCVCMCVCMCVCRLLVSSVWSGVSTCRSMYSATFCTFRRTHVRCHSLPSCSSTSSIHSVYFTTALDDGSSTSWLVKSLDSFHGPTSVRGTPIPPSHPCPFTYSHSALFYFFPFSFFHSLSYLLFSLFSSFVKPFPSYQNSPTLFPGRRL